MASPIWRLTYKRASYSCFIPRLTKGRGKGKEGEWGERGRGSKKGGKGEAGITSEGSWNEIGEGHRRTKVGLEIEEEWREGVSNPAPPSPARFGSMAAENAAVDTVALASPAIMEPSFCQREITWQVTHKVFARHKLMYSSPLGRKVALIPPQHHGIVCVGVCVFMFMCGVCVYICVRVCVLAGCSRTVRPPKFP